MSFYWKLLIYYITPMYINLYFELSTKLLRHKLKISTYWLLPFFPWRFYAFPSLQPCSPISLLHLMAFLLPPSQKKLALPFFLRTREGLKKDCLRRSKHLSHRFIVPFHGMSVLCYCWGSLRGFCMSFVWCFYCSELGHFWMICLFFRSKCLSGFCKKCTIWGVWFIDLACKLSWLVMSYKTRKYAIFLYII